MAERIGMILRRAEPFDNGLRTSGKKQTADQVVFVCSIQYLLFEKGTCRKGLVCEICIWLGLIHMGRQ